MSKYLAIAVALLAPTALAVDCSSTEGVALCAASTLTAKTDTSEVCAGSTCLAVDTSKCCSPTDGNWIAANGAVAADTVCGNQVAASATRLSGNTDVAGGTCADCAADTWAASATANCAAKTACAGTTDGGTTDRVQTAAMTTTA